MAAETPAKTIVPSKLFTSGRENRFAGTFTKSKTFIKPRRLSINKPLQVSGSEENNPYISDQLQSINQNIIEIGSNINNFAAGLEKQLKFDQRAEQVQRLSKKRKEEDQERREQEKGLERDPKIRPKLKKVQNQVGKSLANPLEKLKQVFLLLLGGWITDKVLKLFENDGKTAKEKWDQYGKDLAVGITAALGAFAIMSGGLLGAIGTIGVLGLKIGAFLLIKPFEIFFKLTWSATKALAKSAWNTAKKLWEKPPSKPDPKAKPKPGGGVAGGGAAAGAGAGTSSGNVRGNQMANRGGRTLAGRDNLGTFNREVANKPTAPKPKKGFFSFLNKFNPINFIKQKLASLQTGTLFGKGAGVQKFLYKNLVQPFKSGALSKIPAVKAAGDVVENGSKFFSKANLKNLGKDFLKRLRGGAILSTVFGLFDIAARAQGRSPAQAIIPSLVKIAMGASAGALGSLVPIPGLNILTSIGAGFLGDWLGQKVVDWADANWDPSWDSGIFKGFNEAILGLQESIPALQGLFPYKGTPGTEGDTPTASKSTIREDLVSGAMNAGAAMRDVVTGEKSISDVMPSFEMPEINFPPVPDIGGMLNQAAMPKEEDVGNITVIPGVMRDDGSTGVGMMNNFVPNISPVDPGNQTLMLSKHFYGLAI